MLRPAEATINEYRTIQHRIGQIPQVKTKFSVSQKSAIGDFFRRSAYAFRLILTEKEILVFALLQVIIVAIVYYIWVQSLGWIPESVWRDEEKLTEFALNMLFLIWSFLCVGLAAFPLGLLNGCMGAAHFLTKQGKHSTIANCMKLSFTQATKLWVLAWADGWFTVNRILDRLPRKNWSWNPVAEASYFAWKLGTIGLLPATLIGKQVSKAAIDAVNLTIENPKDLLLLRIGYSFMCWVVGIGSYIGALFFLIYNPELFAAHPGVFGFYLLMGLPIVIAAAIVLIFLRPLYVISSCSIYSDYLKTQKERIRLPRVSAPLNAIVAFVVLAIIVLALFTMFSKIGLIAVANRWS